MHRTIVNTQTGEVIRTALTSDEIAQAKTHAQQVAQAEAQWKADNATQLRRAAYIAEADPLFFKAQRGEIEQQEWLDKIAEIKARYPKE